MTESETSFPLLRQMAGIAGFEIIGRIPLMDKATGKEYR